MKIWLALLVLLAAHALAAAKPNIIVYLSDDHGVDFVGCYGNSAIHTPNIDALARQGTRFTKVFAGSPTCSPSRAVIWTGLYPARNGTMGNHTTCRPDVQALPGYLRAQGYRVVAANKTDVRPKEVFDFEYIPATLPKNPENNRKYRAEGLAPGPIDKLLAEHKRDHPDQPLLLIAGDNGPHVTWEKNKTYDPATLPLLPVMVDTPKTRTALANYYQDITSVDQRLGKVLASLTRHGYDDNTLVIYTSDQGPEWPHCKWTTYDTGLRVPFIIRWPGKLAPAPGSVSDALISLADLAPTLIDIAGGSPPEHMDGRSFRKLLLGETKTHRDRIHASHTGDGEMNQFPQRCVRDERYKYILNLHADRKWTTHFTKVDGIPDSHKEVYDTWLAAAAKDPAAAKIVDILERHAPEELYDTQADPYEVNNLAGKAEMKPLLEKFRAELAAWRKGQNDKDDP